MPMDDQEDERLRESPATSRTVRIHDLPEEERPREKLARHGAQALSEAELLAIFFRIGCQGMNAIEMSRALLEKYGSLHALSRVRVDELAKGNKGIGPAKAAELAAVFEMGNRLAKERLRDTPLGDPESIYEFMAPEMQRLPTESLRVLLLNTRLRLVKVVTVSTGSVGETIAHPREILHPVLVNQCHGFALVHNHPSGDPEPSAADRHLTRRVKECAELMRLQMVDHLIIGHPSAHADATGYFSFQEHGML